MEGTLACHGKGGVGSLKSRVSRPGYWVPRFGLLFKNDCSEYWTQAKTQAQGTLLVRVQACKDSDVNLPHRRDHVPLYVAF
jgi:hypothetical protein